MHASTRSGCKRFVNANAASSPRPSIALDDGVALFVLTIDERAIILAALEDPPEGLAELRVVLLNEHEWRQREGLG